MKTFKVNYLAPNTEGKHTRYGRCPVYIHKIATYTCETEEEAIERFNKYHSGKPHHFQFVWEETDIDRMRSFLTNRLMPRH